MSTPTSARPSRRSAHALHDRFLTLVLPAVLRHARHAFRHVRCSQHRDDLTAEAVGLAWTWFLRLHQRRKDVAGFVTTFARFAARAAGHGRRVAGQDPAKEVLSPRAQRRHRFAVEPYPTSTARSYGRLSSPHGQRELNEFEERLRDNRTTPVPDQAAFRVDFPRWLGRQSDRDRRLALAMIQEASTTELAVQFGVSPGRVSQLRRRLMEDWQQFTA